MVLLAVSAVVLLRVGVVAPWPSASPSVPATHGTQALQPAGDLTPHLRARRAWTSSTTASPLPGRQNRTAHAASAQASCRALRMAKSKGKAAPQRPSALQQLLGDAVASALFVVSSSFLGEVRDAAL